MDLNIHALLPNRKDYRIGILGSGFIVNDCHLVAYRKAGFNPVAIASRSVENATKVAQRHAIPKVYGTYDELLDDPTVEVLDIAVPPNAQLDLIKAACERRTVRGILAQKPLGMDYGQALEAVEVCEAAGIRLAVNQNMRYDQSVRAAKTLLEQGVIGEPVLATIEMRGIPHWMPWQAELGWVTLRIMSIHHLDCFRYWFGDPEGIYCSVRLDPRTKFPHTDGICTYILEYRSGMRCVGLDDTWTGPAKEGCPADVYIQWRIEGLNGLAIGDIGWCKDPYTTPSTIRYASKGDKSFHEPRWTESWFPDAFVGTMAQLLIALENNAVPAISGRDNLKTMALVDAAYESANQFRSILLEEFVRRQGKLPRDYSRAERVEPTRQRGFFRRLISKVQAEADSISHPTETDGNFTPRAQQVLSLARKEADRFNHNFVGTEHVLLGMIRLGQGVAVNVLQKLGLNLESVRLEVEKQVGTGPDQKMVGPIPYTPRVKKVLSIAAKEAKALNHTYVGTEHILLGLLREGDGVAARVLKALEIDVERVRSEILKELDPNFEGLSPVSIRVPNSPSNAPAKLNAGPDLSGSSHQVLLLAAREADWFNANEIHVRHLLLGLLRLQDHTKDSVLGQLFAKLGTDTSALRFKAERTLTRGGTVGAIRDLPYAQVATQVLSLAAEEAKELKSPKVEPEHLFLALLREDKNVVAGILKSFNLDLALVRKCLAEMTGQGGEQPPS